MNEEHLFHQALELPPPERSAFLDAACGGDHALRRRLDQLLRAHDDPGSFLKDPLLPSSGSTPVGEVTQALEAVAPKPSEGAGTLPDRGAAAGADELSFLAPSERPDALGRLEHYHILEIIGRGGFGTVLKAFDEKLHRVVAIKVLSPELAASGTARQRFIREARTAAAVTHEHVVTIHAVVEEHRPPYLVMQLIDGVTLQEKLDEVGMLGLREILRIGMQAAEGLAAAHKQGLVHRDIKPANILLENGVERVKITDFGLARAVDDASVTQSGVVAGTPMYMSPEQAEGLPLDHRSDLFSLGTVLYVMCTGRPPFRATGTMAVLKRVIEDRPRPIREINPDIPDWLCDIIGKLHAKKPAERYPTAREVADLLSQRLADVQAGRAIPRHGEPGPPRTESLPRRAEPRQGPDAPSTTSRSLSRAGAPGSPKRRTLLAAIALLALTAGGLAFTEWTGLTRILGRPATYELTLLVERSADQPDLPTIRYGAARDKETPDEFAERFREMARKQHFADAGIAITAFGGNKLSLPAGTKWWILCEKNGDLLYHKLVTVDRSQEVHLPWATELANRQKVDSKTEPGWVQLFNGKDLKDWEMSPADGWKIENGLLVSNGRRASISLRKPLFGDGICRLEYKLAEHATANLGVRTQAKKPKAALWLGNGKEDEKTGSIVVLDAQAGSKIVAMSCADVHRKDEWQVAELIMRGNEMIVKIDGLETARHTFADLPARGNVGLYVSPGLMQIREIAIKELPAENNAPASEFALAFDGKASRVVIPSFKYYGDHPLTVEAWAVLERPAADIVAEVLLGNPESGGFAFSVGPTKNPGPWAFVIGMNEKPPFLLRPAIAVRQPPRHKLVHFAGVYDGKSEIRFYVDGKLESRLAAVGQHKSSPMPLVLGANPEMNDKFVEHFLGRIHGVRLSRAVRYNDDFTPAKSFQNDEHTLALYRIDEGYGDKLTDSSGRNHHGKIIGAMWVKADGSPVAQGGPGWVQLFNGKDLTGWKKHPEDPGSWSIEDGAITGSSGESYLFTDKGDYENFHLRAEARVNAEGDGGIMFRTGFQVLENTNGRLGVRLPGGTSGYEATVNLQAHWPSHTGSLELPGGTLQKAPLKPHRPDEWFLLEIIARGNHLQTLVNGRPSTDYHDASNRFTRGHIALQNFAWKKSTTRIQFRKIEIKELPPAESGWIIVDPHQDSKIDHQGRRATFDLPGKFRGMIATQVSRTTDAPRLVRTIEGDFDLRAKLAPLPKLPGKPSTGLGSGSIAAGLLLWHEDEAFLTLFQMKIGGSDKGMVYLQGADAGQPYPLDPKFRAQVLADPTKPIHLRIERRGRIVRGYLSADGKDWTLAREITTKFPARISAGVCASINQATGAQVEFTELTLVPVNTAPAVAPAKEK